MKMGVFFLKPLVPGFWSVYGFVGITLTEIELIEYRKRNSMVERRCQSNQERTRKGNCGNKHELIRNSIPLLNDRRGSAASKDNPSTSKTNVLVIKHARLPRCYSAHGLLALDDKIAVRKDSRDTAWVWFLHMR